MKQAVKETTEYCFRLLKYSVRGNVLRHLYQKYTEVKQPSGSEFYLCIHKYLLVPWEALFAWIQAWLLLAMKHILEQFLLLFI